MFLDPRTMFGRTLDLVRQDVRVAFRTLAKTRGFTATAVGTLALGLGASTAVVSYLDAALVRPLPFREPSRLVMLYTTSREQDRAPERQRWSYARYRLLRQMATTVEHVASYGPQNFSLAGDGEPQRVGAEQVAASYFAALGISAALGRTFTADEDSLPGTSPVAVIGDALWRRQFGADPSIIGRSISVQGVPLTVVGVMPPGFQGLTGNADVWTPQTMAPTVSWPDNLTTNQNFLSVVARLRPGVSVTRAQREMAVLGTRIQEIAPSEADVPTVWSATAVPLAELRIDATYRRTVLFLAGAVACLLLIACANVANLLLGRAVTRRREMALRIALGAGRGWLVRQLLVEGFLLAMAGALFGLPLAAAAVRWLAAPRRVANARNLWGQLSEFSAAAIDGRTLGVMLCTVVATTLLFALAPALSATRVELAAVLKEGGAGATRGALSPGRLDARSLVVMIEVALALVLCVGAALMLESLRRLHTADVGIDSRDVITFRMEPNAVRYPAERAPALVERVLERMAAVPGVRWATVDGCAPLGVTCASSTLYIAGRPLPSPGQAPPIRRHYVGPDHFRALGIPLLAGRAFTASDRSGQPHVAIINATARRTFWPTENPIGQRVWFGGGSTFDRPDSSAEIVGVVGDVRYGALDESIMRPSVYTPYLQFTYAARTVMVKTSGAARATASPPMVAALRQAVRGAEPDLPIFDVQTMEERLASSWSRTRFNATLVGTFAVAALVLAAVGLYAVMAHAVTERTREIGIRMALGADAVAVQRLVVRQGLVVTAGGLATGVLAALALTRLVQSMLYGVRATDPVVYVALVVLLGGVAALASYLPARRASRVDPLVALREG